jgi:uncharacterized protein YbjT (DUF2867 family)
MKVAVAGGTGLVGSRVVERLRARGDEVVVLARSAGIDIVAGTGLREALAGVEVVIDTTSIVAKTPQEYIDFFGAVARNLQQAGAAAGVSCIVTLSIVGIDGLGGGAFAHYDGKNVQERETEAGPVPTAILRATQFHGFAGQLIDWVAKGPLMPCPKQPVQTVDVDAVADELVTLAHEAASGQLGSDRVRRDIAGPEKRMLADLVRAVARARGRKLLVIPVWLPGAAAKKVRSGVLQAPAGATIAGGTFDAWLAREYGGPSRTR